MGSWACTPREVSAKKIETRRRQPMNLVGSFFFIELLLSVSLPFRWSYFCKPISFAMAMAVSKSILLSWVALSRGYPL
jgi:hypothetical protein